MRCSKWSPVLAGGFGLGLLLSMAGPCSVQAQSHPPTVVQLFAFGCVTSGKPPHQTTTCPMGAGPDTLLQSEDGAYYGAALSGGAGGQGKGIVFKLTPAGQFTTLYTFVADRNGNFPNGAGPTSLVEGDDGALYGAAGAGVSTNGGVVFKLSKRGAFQVLSRLPGAPYNLIVGPDGALYGFVAPDVAAGQGGAAFRLTTNGAYRVLHAFNQATEGLEGLGATFASDGNIYGTTTDGGDSKITSFFRLTPAGQFTVLRTIHYGQFPVGAPIQAANGKLYGALDFVEPAPFVPGLFASGFSGADYRQIPLAYAFGDTVSDIIDASDATFWGQSFELSANGSLVNFARDGKPLRQIDFDGSAGVQPFGLLQSGDGTILGVTSSGGAVPAGQTGGGAIFVLLAGLPPPKPLFVSPTPASGAVGASVTLHGAHFVGTKAVTFNGVKAAFRVLSTGTISTIVPAGASTGPVVVTNAGGAGSTNFVVN